MPTQQHLILAGDGPWADQHHLLVEHDGPLPDVIRLPNPAADHEPTTEPHIAKNVSPGTPDSTTYKRIIPVDHSEEHSPVMVGAIPMYQSALAPD